MVTEHEQAAMDSFSRRLFLNTDEAVAYQRAMVGVAYWLDCSPHEQTADDAKAMATFLRMIAPRIGVPLDQPQEKK